jgi:hypothetical protein
MAGCSWCPCPSTGCAPKAAMVTCSGSLICLPMWAVHASIWRSTLWAGLAWATLDSTPTPGRRRGPAMCCGGSRRQCALRGQRPVVSQWHGDHARWPDADRGGNLWASVDRDGNLGARRVFAALPGVSPDGLCLDAQRAVRVADAVGKAVCGWCKGRVWWSACRPVTMGARCSSARRRAWAAKRPRCRWGASRPPRCRCRTRVGLDPSSQPIASHLFNRGNSHESLLGAPR